MSSMSMIPAVHGPYSMTVLLFCTLIPLHFLVTGMLCMQFFDSFISLSAFVFVVMFRSVLIRILFLLRGSGITTVIFGAS
jgi:hypothetical protein